jgi:hypothetical protein
MRNSRSSPEQFSDDREALDFIASRIAEEAQRDGVSLSEVERKMLYFSEAAWTLPEIWEVSDEFDRDYEPHSYEKKISHLIKRFAVRARKGSREEFDAWMAALRHLGKQDRYLLVMVKQAGLGRTAGSYKWWRLCFAGAVLTFLYLLFAWTVASLHPVPGGYSPRSGRYQSPLSEAMSFSYWAFPVAICILYGIFQLILGARKVNEFSSRCTKWIFGTGKFRKRS